MELTKPSRLTVHDPKTLQLEATEAEGSIVHGAFINPQENFERDDSHRRTCPDFGGHLDAEQMV
jgi:hypothetical protein